MENNKVIPYYELDDFEVVNNMYYLQIQVK